MNSLSENDQQTALETRLYALGRSFPYPRTPNVDAKAGHPTVRAGRFSSYSLGFIGLAILIVLVGLWAVPPVRAAVGEWIQIGAIRIFMENLLPGDGYSSGIGEGDFILADWQSFSGETTLAEAGKRLGQPLPLPSYPPDLGLPNRVFYQENGGKIVVLLWTKPGGEGVKLSLLVLGPGAFVGKGEPEIVEQITVRGHAGLWLQGAHELVLMSGTPPLERLYPVTGNVLIWEEAGRTWRLEGDLSRREAIRIADSFPADMAVGRSATN